MTHGGVEKLREEEGHGGLERFGLQTLGLRREIDAESLQDVRSARRTGTRPVAVLGHSHPGAGTDERRHRRDVHRVCHVATGADDVERRARHLESARVFDHDVREALKLLHGLALGVKSHEERSHPDGRDLPGHDRVHGPTSLLIAEVLTSHEV